MELRDILKDQIEQLGKALGNILAEFLKLKSNGNTAEGIEITNKQLLGQLDIDIKKIKTLSGNELSDYLNRRRLTAEHLEILSDYLKEVGINIVEANKQQANLWFEKAIVLLDLADQTTEILSFERVEKKIEIEKRIVT